MFDRILIGGLAGLLLASCVDDTSAPDVAAFRRLNEQLVAAVDTHESHISAMTDMPACTEEHDRYEAEVRPIVEEMRDMSMDMDDCMMAMGHESTADMQRTCEAMDEELNTHLGVACSSSDLSQDRAESERHCTALRQMAQQEMGRADDMMPRGGMMSGGTCHD